MAGWNEQYQAKQQGLQGLASTAMNLGMQKQQMEQQKSGGFLDFFFKALGTIATFAAL
jgi:hypothetical protein